MAEQTAGTYKRSAKLWIGKLEPPMLPCKRAFYGKTSVCCESCS